MPLSLPLPPWGPVGLAYLSASRLPSSLSSFPFATAVYFLKNAWREEWAPPSSLPPWLGLSPQGLRMAPVGPLSHWAGAWFQRGTFLLSQSYFPSTEVPFSHSRSPLHHLMCSSVEVLPSHPFAVTVCPGLLTSGTTL